MSQSANWFDSRFVENFALAERSLSIHCTGCKVLTFRRATFFCLCCDCLCIYNSLRLRMMFPKLLHTGWPCLYHCLCHCCHWLCFLTSSCVQDFHVMSMYVVSLSLLSLLRMMVPRFQHTGRPPWAAIGWVPGAWLQVVVSRIVFLNIFWPDFF